MGISGIQWESKGIQQKSTELQESKHKLEIQGNPGILHESTGIQKYYVDISVIGNLVHFFAPLLTPRPYLKSFRTAIVILFLENTAIIELSN